MRKSSHNFFLSEPSSRTIRCESRDLQALQNPVVSLQTQYPYHEGFFSGGLEDSFKSCDYDCKYNPTTRESGFEGYLFHYQFATLLANPELACLICQFGCPSPNCIGPRWSLPFATSLNPALKSYLWDFHSRRMLGSL
jgi:hypothetical protein